MKDDEAKACMACKTEFGWTTRRSHCLSCGRVLCAACVPTKMRIRDAFGKDGHVVSGLSEEAVKVCEECVEWVKVRDTICGVSG